VIIKADYKK